MKKVFTELFVLKNTRKFDLTLIKPWLLIIGLINYLIKFIIYYKNTSDFIKINRKLIKSKINYLLNIQVKFNKINNKLVFYFTNSLFIYRMKSKIKN